MSKLSFRARQLDANKALPVYQAEELPDLSEFSTINRAVPQMPTGMEKEEESEHHLQRAISAQQVYGDTQQLVIPTPDSEEMKTVPSLVRNNFKQPKQYIHVQERQMQGNYDVFDIVRCHYQEILTILQLESILEKLEKGMGAQACMSYGDAKALLQESEDIVKPVFDYWTSKREKLDDCLVCLIPQNRKNDEAGYEKMLKLRRDLKRACTILDMVKRREQTKKELLELTVNVFEHSHRRPKGLHHAKMSRALSADGQPIFSDNDDESGQLSPSQLELPSEPEEDDDDPDGRYAFKRKKGVKYLPPRFDSPLPYPWIDPSEGGLGDKRYRYCCTSISSPQRLIGFARQRRGRGGR
ncbi:hypothetical protein QZH41_000373 [Actinostola sp. cb2023]|nr:hypothetical protein QZH41_000373 [Actinostola sp. cb2023]